MSDDQLLRLSKLMSQRGLCSRREADKLIADGLVSVDGQIVTQLGTKVLPHVDIEIQRRGQKILDDKVTFLLNKPVGYVSAQAEDGHTPAVRFIHRHSQDPNFDTQIHFHKNQLIGLAPAGRLDIDSKGLLVLTQNGKIAKDIIGPNNTVEKEYIVKVTGHINRQVLERLRYGLSLDGQKLRKAQVQQLNEHTLNFCLNEGKKRQIRRMCDLVDLKVTSLQRIRIGKIKLAQLKEGCWRYLEKHESF